MCSRAKSRSAERLLVARPSPTARHGSTPSGEAALGLPHVADPRDRALVEQRLADRTGPGSPRSQPAQEQRRVEASPSTSGPSAQQARVGPRTRVADAARARAVELDHLPAAAAQHQPCAATRAPPALALAMDAHAPVMRRCECTVRSPSKRRNRCLPCASTERTASPAKPLRPAIEPVAGMAA